EGVHDGSGDGVPQPFEGGGDGLFQLGAGGVRVAAGGLERVQGLQVGVGAVDRGVVGEVGKLLDAGGGVGDQQRVAAPFADVDHDDGAAGSGVAQLRRHRGAGEVVEAGKGADLVDEVVPFAGQRHPRVDVGGGWRPGRVGGDGCGGGRAVQVGADGVQACGEL